MKLSKKVRISIIVFSLLLVISTALFFLQGENIFKNKPLPALYVDGPFIKRADTGEPIQLKGVASSIYLGNKALSFSKRKYLTQS